MPKKPMSAKGGRARKVRDLVSPEEWRLRCELAAAHRDGDVIGRAEEARVPVREAEERPGLVVRVERDRRAHV